jgi:4-hydroxy-4-methyl-2-oxoglutarate aldolase
MSATGNTPAIVEDVPRPDPELVRRLAGFGAATVCEADPRVRVMDGIAPRYPGSRIAGAAVTCLNRAGDNLMLHAAMAQCRPGDVLVVAVHPRSSHGMFGDLLATQAKAAGVVAAVLDSGVRDTAAMREMGFPTWSRTVTVNGTTKLHRGTVNHPVVCGGALVEPGDVVVADDDGVVVVPAAAAADTVAGAAARTEREATLRRRYQAGEASLDVSGLRERLAETGPRHTALEGTHA